MSYNIRLVLASIRRGSAHRILMGDHHWVTPSGKEVSVHYHSMGKTPSGTVYEWKDCNIIAAHHFPMITDDFKMVQRAFLKKTLN